MALHIPTTTWKVRDVAHRHGRLLNSDVADDERMVSISLPRVTIAERRRDEHDISDRPKWKGPPAQPSPAPMVRAAISPRVRQRPAPVLTPSRAWRFTPLSGEASARFAPAPWPSFVVPETWPVARGKAHVIIAMVARKAGMTVDEMRSARRNKDIVLARRVAVAVLLRFTRLSLPQVGRLLGRDHTTIMHARDCVARDIGSLVQFPDDPGACADALFAALRGARK